MKTFYRITGLICTVYGIVILGILGTRGLFNYFYLVAGLFLLVLGIFWDRMSQTLRKIVAAFTITLGLLFVFVEGMIIYHAVAPADENVDYVILLGSRVRNDGPSVDFRARIDATYQYALENPDTMIIATGGQGYDEPVSEASAARDYLVERGIPSERILLEDKSTNTVENIENSRAIILGRGDDPEDCSVIIISASYHLCRARFIAGKYGFENVGTLGSNGLAILIPHYYTREFFALAKDFVFLNIFGTETAFN